MIHAHVNLELRCMRVFGHDTSQVGERRIVFGHQQEARNTFARFEELPDLDSVAADKDYVPEQKQEMGHTTHRATPEQMSLVPGVRTMQSAGNMTGPVHALSS